jgi:2-phosphosulfolactate phosphatase
MPAQERRSNSSLSIKFLVTWSIGLFCGSCTNCRPQSPSVAIAATQYGKHIAVIAAGEKWENRSLRPAFENLVGAGAILSHLKGSLLPEAQTVIATYSTAQPNLKSLLKHCSSGKELIARGFEQDIDL